LREFFEAELGPSFIFDRVMRSFISNGVGRTLGDAIHEWHSTRGAMPKPIAEQFELNRFTRRWHAEHPVGGRAELLAAWRVYRSLPEDARGPA